MCLIPPSLAKTKVRNQGWIELRIDILKNIRQIYHEKLVYLDKQNCIIIILNKNMY